MKELKTVSQLVQDPETGIYISHNRYGGGFVASLVYGLSVETHDSVFTGSDVENHLGEKCMIELGLPFATGETPQEAVNGLLRMAIGFEDWQLSVRYDILIRVVLLIRTGYTIESVVDAVIKKELENLR